MSSETGIGKDWYGKGYYDVIVRTGYFALKFGVPKGIVVGG